MVGSMAMAIPIQVVFDCANPSIVARFWADALGYRLQGPPEPDAEWQAWLVEHGVPEEQWDDASAIIDPGGNGPRIYFQRVPEPKAVKNRLAQAQDLPSVRVANLPIILQGRLSLKLKDLENSA